MNTLVVTNPFGGKGVGERITDPAEIAAVLAGEHAHHVVRASHHDVIVALAAAPEIDEPTTEEA